ncbi:MAG TPA: hypothetical protein VHL34_14130 [Rhizomicrobium sp.]|jgi:hypothetical protein|nr:hypothetical protein [Rhizomicrobium sp.]
MRKSTIAACTLLTVLAATNAQATKVSLDGFCNRYVINKLGNRLFSLRDGGCSSAFGGGVNAKITGLGSQLVISVSDPSAPDTQFMFEFQYPLATGNSWQIYSTNDGVTFTSILSGTYTVGAPASAHPTRRSPSATAPLGTVAK